MGAEYMCYCSFPPCFVCDCKPKRKEHFSHRMQEFPQEQVLNTLSEAIQLCESDELKVISKSQELIQLILETTQHKLDSTKNIKNNCLQIKSKFESPTTRVKTFLDNFDGVEPNKMLSCVLSLVQYKPPCLVFFEPKVPPGLETKLPVKRAPKKNFQQKLTEISLNHCSFLSINSELKNVLQKADALLSVDLYEQLIGDQGACLIAKVLPYSNIQALHLRRNKIAWEGAAAIAKALPKSQVTHLNFQVNCIEDNGLKALAEALSKCKLCLLDLEKNSISCKGVSYLCNSLSLSTLKCLSLSMNLIGNEGAIALAEAIKHSSLEELFLRKSGIKTKGGEAIAQGLRYSRICLLNLSGNTIVEKAIKAIASSKSIELLI